MALSLPTTRAPMSVPKRLLLFGAAVALGAIGGIIWNVEASNFAYNALREPFIDPSGQIAGPAMGVGLAFVLGFIHITSI